MFSEKFDEVLKNYGARRDKIFKITTDNPSTNNKMANHLSQKLGGFNNTTCLLGYDPHVVNQAAKVGILLLGSMEDEQGMIESKLPTSSMGSKDHHPERNDTMGILYLTTTSNDTQVNAQSTLKKVHGLCKWVCFSPNKVKNLRRLFHFLNLIFTKKKKKRLGVLSLMSQLNGTQL